ncbi:MAG: translation initiation factor IF-5A [Thaumarchaeota archaeon]|nr:translation initiation factor IF-5A [Nitrososphaerota archaeon]
MLSRPADLSSVKEGSYIMIEGEPSRIVSYDKSKPGKHGSAKARVVAIGLFDGVKRSIVSPVSANIEIPQIEKRSAQVISKTESSSQLMDLETFETFEVPPPEEEKLREKMVEGSEVEYWSVLGRTKIVRVKG